MEDRDVDANSAKDRMIEDRLLNIFGAVEEQKIMQNNSSSCQPSSDGTLDNSLFNIFGDVEEQNIMQNDRSSFQPSSDVTLDNSLFNIFGEVEEQKIMQADNSSCPLASEINLEAKNTMGNTSSSSHPPDLTLGDDSDYDNSDDDDDDSDSDEEEDTKYDYNQHFQKEGDTRHTNGAAGHFTTATRLKVQPCSHCNDTRKRLSDENLSQRAMSLDFNELRVSEIFISFLFLYGTLTK
jgi:hypothetical protein